MIKKLTVLSVVLFVIPNLSSAMAEEYAIDDYLFVWNVVKAGNTRLKVEKSQEGLTVLLSSRGGRIATVSMAPSDAVEISRVLMETETYFQNHKKHYDQIKEKNKPLYREALTDDVAVGEFHVVFASTPRGESFSVKVGPKKMFAPMALFTKDEALAMANYLRDAEKLAEIVNANVSP